MPPLSFRLGFKSSEFQSMDLPVEVRRPNSSLLTRTVSSEQIDVPAGGYFVYSRLPGAGNLLIRSCQRYGCSAALLSPLPEDESPHESHEVQLFSTGFPTHER
jgi:hypothetical protein